MLFEMRKNAKYLYDLPIARDVKTQNPIIVQEKSRRTQCTILGKAEAKKKKLLLSAIESDLDRRFTMTRQERRHCAIWSKREEQTLRFRRMQELRAKQFHLKISTLCHVPDATKSIRRFVISINLAA